MYVDYNPVSSRTNFILPKSNPVRGLGRIWLAILFFIASQID